MDDPASALERLVATVLQSAKYRSICPDLVQSIGAQELGKRRNPKAAVKATKDRLHQVGGAYLGRKLDYAACLERIRLAAQGQDAVAFRRSCIETMELHASSRERLSIIEDFYSRTLGPLQPIQSILDVACGLNPLALPWMPVAEGVEYHACDIYQDMIEFLSEFLPLAGARGSAEVYDVARSCPAYEVDVALVLKTIPCLEQLDRTVGRRLLADLRARHILVSFPVRSLCGAHKGMVTNYETHFYELVAGRGWAVTRFEFPTELAFLVSKGAAGTPTEGCPS